MNTIIALAVAACSVVGCAPTRDAEPPAKPVCEPGEVTVSSGQPTPCDLQSPANTLTLVWNAETEGEGWGGDASVANAEAAALDAGCTPSWINDGDYRLVGTGCDF